MPAAVGLDTSESLARGVRMTPATRCCTATSRYQFCLAPSHRYCTAAQKSRVPTRRLPRYGQRGVEGVIDLDDDQHPNQGSAPSQIAGDRVGTVDEFRCSFVDPCDQSRVYRRAVVQGWGCGCQRYAGCPLDVDVPGDRLGGRIRWCVRPPVPLSLSGKCASRCPPPGPWVVSSRARFPRTACSVCGNCVRLPGLLIIFGFRSQAGRDRWYSHRHDPAWRPRYPLRFRSVVLSVHRVVLDTAATGLRHGAPGTS